MKQILRENVFFLLPYLIFLISGGIVLFFFSKESIHLSINNYHHPLADIFFSFITWLGDGWMAVIIVAVSVFFRYRYAILIGSSYLISSLITQLLKRTIFSDELRPVKFFENTNTLYLVRGVEQYMYNSFPSGHATTSFSVYLALAMISGNRYLQFIFFVIAFLVAFSRVYISQHFFDDVYAGSLIGTVSALFVFYFSGKYSVLNFSWVDNSFLKKRQNETA